MQVNEREPYQEELDCIYNLFFHKKFKSKIALIILSFLVPIANFFYILVPFYIKKIEVISFFIFLLITFNIIMFLIIRSNLSMIKTKDNDLVIGNVFTHKGKIHVIKGRFTARTLIGQFTVNIPISKKHLLENHNGQLIECELIPYIFPAWPNKIGNQYFVVSFNDYAIKEEIYSGRYKLKYLNKRKTKTKNLAF